jgi:hypothetical protein
LHECLLRLSGAVCSDETAYGQPPSRACYLGRPKAELFGEFDDVRVAVLQQSKQDSHLRGGLLALLEQLEQPVE